MPEPKNIVDTIKETFARLKEHLDENRKITKDLKAANENVEAQLEARDTALETCQDFNKQYKDVQQKKPEDMLDQIKKLIEKFLKALAEFFGLSEEEKESMDKELKEMKSGEILAAANEIVKSGTQLQAEEKKRDLLDQKKSQNEITIEPELQEKPKNQAEERKAFAQFAQNALGNEKEKPTISRDGFTATMKDGSFITQEKTDNGTKLNFSFKSGKLEDNLDKLAQALKKDYDARGVEPTITLKNINPPENAEIYKQAFVSNGFTVNPEPTQSFVMQQ